ncbi:uncharacterized protein [Primulina eburnea]|uniref:uncharacterized protein n=1 Tax=Primulina eburnea TaxID=1245227 RepID=UPI003C6C2343
MHVGYVVWTACTKIPPRSILPRNDEDRHEAEIPQPTPNQDASACVLAGMALLLEQHVGNGAKGRPEAIYEQFRMMNPEDFCGTTYPFVADGWIISMEVIFCYMDMADTDRFRCTIYLLNGGASLWWEGTERGVNLVTLIWEGFKRVFYDKYFTSDVRSRLKREFMSLRQEELSVSEIRNYDFLNGFRPTNCRDVILVDPTDYTTVVAQQANQQNKKPYTGPPKRLGPPKPQGLPSKYSGSKTAEKPQCKECNRQHYGKCMWGTYKCFKCREMGHKVGDCPKLMQPTTGRAYVMHAEQAEPDTKLITGTYALLDSGATNSFISESFMKKLGILPVDVESGFRVTVTSGDHMVSSSMVKDAELKLKNNIILADLILLPMPEFDIILSMDRLPLNGATIGFRQRTISISPPHGKAFIFEVEQNNQMPHIIPCMRARKLIQKGCQGFLASIISAPDIGSQSIEDVEVIKDFSDVFHDDISGIPPESEVEFAIESMPVTVPISKARYQLAPAELKEFKDKFKSC